MPIDATIYIRTGAGQQEIHNKSHGLTQSERLVLVMVDGVATCSALAEKLRVLSPERLDSAVTCLVKQGLIVQASAPKADQSQDDIHPTVRDRFLQQSPSDPVTMLRLDEDDDEDDWQLAPAMPGMTKYVPPALDEVHIQLAETVTEEVRAMQEARVRRLEPIEMAAQRIFAEERARQASAKGVNWRAYLPYALLLTGLAFIAGFAVARLLD